MFNLFPSGAELNNVEAKVTLFGKTVHCKGIKITNTADAVPIVELSIAPTALTDPLRDPFGSDISIGGVLSSITGIGDSRNFKQIDFSFIKKEINYLEEKLLMRNIPYRTLLYGFKGLTAEIVGRMIIAEPGLTISTKTISAWIAEGDITVEITDPNSIIPGAVNEALSLLGVGDDILGGATRYRFYAMSPSLEVSTGRLTIGIKGHGKLGLLRYISYNSYAKALGKYSEMTNYVTILNELKASITALEPLKFSTIFKMVLKALNARQRVIQMFLDTVDDSIFSFVEQATKINIKIQIINNLIFAGAIDFDNLTALLSMEAPTDDTLEEIEVYLSLKALIPSAKQELVEKLYHSIYQTILTAPNLLEGLLSAANIFNITIQSSVSGFNFLKKKPYIQGLINQNGKMLPSPDIDGPVTVKKINLNSASISFGSQFSLPINQLILFVSDIANKFSASDIKSNAISIAYPKIPAQLGKPVFVAIPNMLIDTFSSQLLDIGRFALTESGRSFIPGTTQVTSIDAVDAVSEESKIAYTKETVNKYNVLYKWAETLFYINAYKESVATITLPIDFSLYPGQVYYFVMQDPSSLIPQYFPVFMGHLVSVVHNIQLSNSGGQSLSHCSFSHVRSGSKIVTGDLIDSVLDAAADVVAEKIGFDASALTEPEIQLYGASKITSGVSKFAKKLTALFPL